MTEKIITRGTTPEISVGFSEIDVEDITNAILVIKQNETAVITKPFNTATTEEDALTWTLTQAETFLLTMGRVAVASVDWLLNDGTRGRSEEIPFIVDDSGVGEVIS